MARRRVPRPDGTTAVRTWASAPDHADRGTVAAAVRFLLEELTEQAPGNAVEVRVPPFGVTQCFTGPTHSRGTPPNVVELPPQTWLRLATGLATWDEAAAGGQIAASGVRADLRDVLPLIAL